MALPEVTALCSVQGHVCSVVWISAGQNCNVAARNRTCFLTIFAALFLQTAFP